MLEIIYLISTAVCVINAYIDRSEFINLSIMDILFILFSHFMPGFNTVNALCIISRKFTEMLDKICDILNKPRWFTK